MSEQLRFAAEFVTFLVAAAGFTMVLLRAELVARSLQTRLALGGGFALLALSAFVSGSLIAGSADDAAVLVPRLIGAIAAGAGGAAGWAGSARSRATLLAGVGLIVATVPFDGSPAAALRVVGAFAVAVALLAAARRSIAARVAASAAAALLVLVLVLSVALSAVLSATVEQEAVERLESRARQEARAVENATQATALPAARVTAASLEGDALGELRAVAATPGPNDVIGRLLDALSSTYLSGRQLAYVVGDTTVVGYATSADQDLLDAVIASDLVREARAGDTTQGGARPEGTGVVVAGGTAAAVAVTVTGFTTPDNPSFQSLGAVIAVVPVDVEYLRAQRRDDDRLAFAVATGESVLATAPGGAQPGERDLRDLARRAMRQAEGSEAFSDHYGAAAAIGSGSEEPVAALIVSTDRGFVDDTRDTIFRTLFLIALGSTLLALLFAAIVGDRIGSGLRRLTTAAGAVSGGDLSARSEIRTEDEVGVLSGAFDSMVTSLSEQRDALAAAAQQEAALRNRVEAIVQGMGEALVAVDAAGVVTDVNRAAEALLETPANALEGRPLADVMTLVNEEEPQRDLVGRVGARRPWVAIGLLGEERVPVGVTATALEGIEGRGGIVLLRDLREERALDTMKREFLSRVGHELRTPLAIITGYSRILSSREADASQVQEWSGYISEKARELERIIEMLEFFAASTTGHELGKTQPVDLRKLLDTTIQRWTERLEGARTVRGRLGRRAVEVRGVPSRLTRSIDELIDNALKFSPPTSTVTVSLRQAGGEAVITVVDRGKGMTADEVEAAFTAFTQGDTSDTRHYGGLGLGLSYAQRVIESHGGRVSIDSAPGKGSRVSIHLPLDEPDPGGTTG